ncbi:hypothetical protein [Paraburkholderia rhynchosiae]|uniref:Uncharacterized protein n=1 Tax=Paraburkholderia rhynchosiae TaxID=487049 RepID=A0A2N7W9E5_9BURK|nr:hypothetical protein [Paraburkholderia rhynchosiae]PMS25999.1 hypothetical protein C0Z16_28100 [Paraburkholderia rhynchosiae]CAB3731025.1 hypothetical protein LMG27174_05799 [Paraburkholderia rhynchosiae]
MNRLLARMLGRLYREENPDDAGGGPSAEDGVRFAFHDRAAWLEQIAGTTEHDQQFGTGTHDDDASAASAGGEDETDEERAAREQAEAEAAAAAGGEHQTDEERAAAAAAAAAAANEDDQMVTLIVDGKEVQRPLSEVVDAGKRYLQKDMTADERIAEATRILKEAKELNTGKPQPAERPSDALQAEDDDAALARAIQLGSDEEARAAIAKLRKGGRTDDHSITSMIDARIEFRETAAWVKDEYKDIFADPLLSGVFMQKEADARAQGDSRPHRDLYKEIGDGLRKWRNGLAPKQDAIQDKVDRKASVTVIPTARAVAPVNPDEGNEEATEAQETAAYIAEQRRRRGQG